MNRKVIPIAQNGATTLDALKLIHKVTKHNPETIIIQFGGNDLSRGVTKEIVRKNIKRLILLIRKNNAKTQIIVVRSAFSGLMNDGNFIRQQKLKTVSFALIFKQPEIYFDQKTKHPNKKGQQKIAQIIIAEIINNE